jgi:AcrR family transcriptional regulator
MPRNTGDRPARTPLRPKEPAAAPRRSYTMRQRRAAMDETRARIVDAAVALYETVGPAATSISAVATRAGITRATLYRHFLTDAELAGAVIGEWRSGVAPATAATLTALPNPEERLRAALAALYAAYRATAPLTASLLRDEQALPAPLREDLRAPARQTRERLMGAGLADPASAPAAAAVGHAVAFETWQSLSAEGLEDRAIVDLMAGLVAFAAAPALPTPRTAAAGAARKAATVTTETPATDVPRGKKAKAEKKAKGEKKAKHRRPDRS